MEDRWCVSNVQQVFRPKNLKNWFPVNPLYNSVVGNDIVDGVRSEILYVFPARDGFAFWRINGQLAEPKDLVKLERNRSMKPSKRLWINKTWVYPSRATPNSKTTVRDLVSVDNEPSLELHKCMASRNRPVKVVDVTPSEEALPSVLIPEVVIQPLPEDHPCFIPLPPQIVVKQEPGEPSASMQQIPVEEIAPVAFPTSKKAGKEIVTTIRRSERVRTPSRPCSSPKVPRIQTSPRPQSSQKVPRRRARPRKSIL